MTKTINSKFIHKLTAIKLLSFEAMKATDASGAQRAFAILHAHDALDWTFQLIFEEFSDNNNKKLMFLSDYAKEIEKLEEGSIHIGNVSKLNSMRNLFKHNFTLPDGKETKEIVEWSENQINALFLRFFKSTLTDIDLINAIPNEEISEKILEADEDISSGKVVEGYCALSIAFEMIKYDLQNRLENATGKKIVFNTDAKFSDSFFLHVEEIIGKGDSFNGASEFCSAWNNLIQSTEYLVDITFINFLGVDVKEYFEFLSVTPRPQRNLAGNKYFCDYSKKLAEKMKLSGYQTQRNFVIEAALKAQGKSY